MSFKMHVVYGNAGCGKTYQLVQLVKSLEVNGDSYIVLAPTHNAVNNIFQKLNCNEIYKNKLKTLHSYFRIDYKNNNRMLGPQNYVQNVIIDEFSLMNKDIYKQILNLLQMNCMKTTLYLFGDPLQLNAVYDNVLDNIVSFTDLLRFERYFSKCLGHNMSMLGMKHYLQSIFFNDMSGVKDIKYSKLTKNYRSTDGVMQVITALRSNDLTFPYTFITKGDIINRLSKPDYYLLASNYEILQAIYELMVPLYSVKSGYVCIKQGKNATAFKRLHLYANCRLRALDTFDNVQNGQELIFKQVIQRILVCEDVITHEQVNIQPNHDGVYAVGPYNMLTVHKSQGYTLENVIVCYNKMFEVSMLYTAVTRASQSVCFYSHYSIPSTSELLQEMHANELSDLEKLSNIIESKANEL